DSKNFAGLLQTNEEEAITLDNTLYMNRGNENNMMVLQDDTIQFKQVAPPGQSGFIAPDGTKSEHYDDQLELFNNWEMYELPFTKEEVTENVEEEITLTISK